jgi:hypothetical protein
MIVGTFSMRTPMTPRTDRQMRLLAWLSARWRVVTLAPERHPFVVPGAAVKRRVPVEYMALHNYLQYRYASTVVLTFEQIESLLGFPLPDLARTEHAWWTGETLPAAGHGESWTMARRRATPNLRAQTVSFERLP